MIQAPIHTDERVVFLETFNSEQETRKKGGVPTDVVYENGVGEFDGSSSKIQVNRLIKGTYSIRMVFSSLTPANADYMFDFRTNGGAGYAYFNSATTFTMGGGGTRYVDGVAGFTVSNNTKEIVIAGITIENNSGFIGCLFGGGSNFIIADYAEFTIYDFTLTAEEVSNLYDSKTYKELGHGSILEVSALSGVPVDRMGNALTSTGVVVKKSAQVRAIEFDDATTFIQASGDLYNLPVTLSCWYLPYAISGEALFSYSDAQPQICFRTRLFGGADKLEISTNNFASALRITGTLDIRKWYHFAVSIDASANVVLYVNGEQDNSGTLTVPTGGTNTTIGKAGAGNLANGLGDKFVIHRGILSADEIMQLYTNERRLFR